MAKPGMTIEGDLNPLLTLVSELQKRKVETGIQFLRSMTFHASERAEANAPIKTGLLRSTIRPLPIVANPAVITGGIETPVFYASWMHDWHYNLGKRTRQQPKTVEGTGPGEGPGRQYVANVLRYHNAKYLNMLDTMVRAMLVGMQGAWTSILQPQNLWHAQSGEGE